MSASMYHGLEGRQRRRVRVRKRIFGTPARPRLSVFRSARHIYAQVIDDEAGRTLAAACSRTLALAPASGAAAAGDGRGDGDGLAPADGASGEASRGDHGQPGGARGKRDAAAQVGRALADRCLAQAIGQVVFDRNGYRYHGRVQAVAEAARAAGLRF